MRIGKVDPTPSNLNHDHALTGLWVIHLNVPEHLGPTKLLNLNHLHAGEP